MVPSLWRHQLQRQRLRQSFLECTQSEHILEQHFFMGQPITHEAKDELATFGDLVVLSVPEEDLEIKELMARRQAEAQTSLGHQVLERPSPAVLRLLGSLVWLKDQRPDLDLVIKLEDSSNVLPRLLEQVSGDLHMTLPLNQMWLGAIHDDFPLTVPPGEVQACETCDIPLEAELFCLEMIRVSMSGMDMGGCLRIASECCRGDSDCGDLERCTAMARQLGMETVLYLGTAFAPPFPDPMAWALGRGCVDFVTENMEDLKMRMDAPELLLGFWLAGLEDMKIEAFGLGDL
ncbi:unnamed protein product [Durusdinium trenchii]|uniref:Uncharacterized protein n=1 Tax=Durusdinium trenchii TaxID=1381693 RepID=A0ABP0IF19_9DINO